ncbi:hypothetical protein RhiirA5_421610, partial [Rhizophagus irregularis]
KDLGLSELALKILENEEINGRTFFKVTKEKLECHGMKLGPVTALVDFAKEYKEKKLRSFSSYKTKKELNEMLCKYGIVSGDITCIPQFIPPTHTINESTPKFKLCIDNILRRIKNMGPVVNSNKSMQCKYISTILHTADRAVGSEELATKKRHIEEIVKKK